MRAPSGRLAIVFVSMACLLAAACGEARAQRSRLSELGADAVELQPKASKTSNVQSVAAATEPVSGSRRPWALTSESALRLPPPPDEKSTAVELRELKRLMAGDDAEKLERIRYWDSESPARHWNEMLVDIGARNDADTTARIRASALLKVAIHDALIAAWDSKYAHKRRRPDEDSALLTPEVAIPRSPSYPSEHAVIAGVAASVLAYLFPADAQRFVAAAHEAAWSRVMAGAVYPSDARAGLELGHAVAARVLEHAKSHDATGWEGFRRAETR